METANSVNLQVAKDFSVPVQRLYEAWITEPDLKAWWHPMGNTLARLVNDIKEGGTVRYEFATEEGAHSFTISGVYKEVEQGKHLQYTWNWEVPSNAVENAEFLLTIDFKESGNGSRLEVSQDNFKDEESVQPHREGWEKALEDLKQYLERKG